MRNLEKGLGLKGGGKKFRRHWHTPVEKKSAESRNSKKAEKEISDRKKKKADAIRSVPSVAKGLRTSQPVINAKRGQARLENLTVSSGEKGRGN